MILLRQQHASSAECPEKNKKKGRKTKKKLKSKIWKQKKS
jgi:hypothetical protein